MVQGETRLEKKTRDMFRVPLGPMQITLLCGTEGGQQVRSTKLRGAEPGKRSACRKPEHQDCKTALPLTQLATGSSPRPDSLVAVGSSNTTLTLNPKP